MAVKAYTNQKEMCAHYHRLLEFCTQHPEVFQRAHVIIDMNNRLVLDPFNHGRAKNRETHALLLPLFDLQIVHDFMLPLSVATLRGRGILLDS